MITILLVLSCGLVATMLIVATASAYRIIVETRLKERILTNEDNVVKKEVSAEDELKQRLQQIRTERFSLIKQPSRQGDAWSHKETITTKK